MEQTENYQVENIDHLGIVSSLCKEVGLTDKINRLLHPNGSNRVVSAGDGVLALILNGMGYSPRRLYLTEQFFENKPLDLLIKPGLTAKDLTADSLGKTLDEIAGYGPSKLFSEISSEIALEKGLLSGPYRLDTTSISVHHKRGDETGLLNLKQGHSKDHRPDLNQLVLSIVMQGPAELPIHMEALDGNSSDKTSFPSTIKQVEALRSNIDRDIKSRWIADSALYSEKNIASLSQVEWITRVPETINQAKEVLSSEGDWNTINKDYRYFETEVTYGEVNQRWMVVRSEPGYQRESKTFEKRVRMEREEAKKGFWHLSNKLFKCEADAKRAADDLSKKFKYHLSEHQVIEKKQHLGRGRPSLGSKPSVRGYQITSIIKEDSQAIEAALKYKGRFILSTNVLDKELLKPELMLEEYKEQQQPERGFRFIKSPEFLVKAVFLKSANRIAALTMIMTLTLFIYNLGQYQVRRVLEKNNESVPNQKKKATQNPTLRWIFELMQGISRVVIILGDKEKKVISKLTDVQNKIVSLLGEGFRQIYGIQSLIKKNILKGV